MLELDGKKVPEIASEHGCSDQSVYQILGKTYRRMEMMSYMCRLYEFTDEFRSTRDKVDRLVRENADFRERLRLLGQDVWTTRSR